MFIVGFQPSFDLHAKFIGCFIEMIIIDFVIVSIVQFSYSFLVVHFVCFDAMLQKLVLSFQFEYLIF